MAVAGVLYVFVIANALNSPTGGGEARIADAFQAVFLTAGLWIMLVVIAAVGGIMGSMPRWSAATAVLLIPLSGIGAFVAIDMCSRNMRWAIAFPALIVPIIALYAYWARSTGLHGALPPRRVSLLAWSAVLVLSIAPMVLAVFY